MHNKHNIHIILLPSPSALPNPTVVITPPASTQAGHNTTLICSVTVVEGLVISPTVKWFKSDGNNIMEVTNTTWRTQQLVTVGANTTLTLLLEPTQYSDGGLYTCMAKTDLRRYKPGFRAHGAASENYSFYVTCEYNSAWSLMYNNTCDNSTILFKIFAIPLLVPSPSVVVMADREGLLYAGTNLTLTCTVTFGERADIPVMESITWIRDGQAHSIFGNSRTMETPTGFDTTNITTLQFYPLKDGEDDGLYSCSVVIEPINQGLFVQKLNITETTNLTVAGQSFCCVVRKPTSFHIMKKMLISRQFYIQIMHT